MVPAMRILVTGGAGFIGSWVVELLLESGHEVLVVDNLSSGRRHNLPAGVQLEVGDIRDGGFAGKVLAGFRPQVIDHHAAQINVRRSAEAPVEDAEVNVLGTLQLLQHAVAHGVQRVIFASSGGAIYGDTDTLPTPETVVPAPVSPYAVAKLAAEHYLKAYHAMHGLQSVVLRYANVYGPRQIPEGEAGVVAIFCNRIQSGEQCIIWGDGEQTRDYVFVQDIARANLAALTATPGVYNLGTGIETSVNVLVDKLRAASSRSVGSEHAPSRPEELRRSVLDASLARKQLGWTPETSLDQGLAHTWTWCLQR